MKAILAFATLIHPFHIHFLCFPQRTISSEIKKHTASELGTDRERWKIKKKNGHEMIKVSHVCMCVEKALGSFN
jgi:hypothetical protein